MKVLTGSFLTKVKITVNYYIEHAFLLFLAIIDWLIFSRLQLEWKHEYRWESHTYTPSKEEAEELEIEVKEYPCTVEFVLYDHNKPVYQAACFNSGDPTPENLKMVDDTKERFFQGADRYMDAHRTFSIYESYVTATNRPKTFVD